MASDPLVYLIEPSNDDRKQISQQLEEVKLEFCAYSDADAFLISYEPARLGCVLTELKLGSSTAFQLVKRLRQRLASLPVVLLTAHATVPLTVQAFKSGVFEVLEKPSEAFQLWECATRAFESHGQEMDRARYRNGIRQRISQLSQQELQVMQMLLEGAPNKYIAAHLELSPRTIVFRRKSLMQKMNAKSVGELACLIQLVASEQTQPFTADPSALLDVHVAANLCEAVGRLNSKNGEYS